MAESYLWRKDWQGGRVGLEKIWKQITEEKKALKAKNKKNSEWTQNWEKIM